MTKLTTAVIAATASLMLASAAQAATRAPAALGNPIVQQAQAQAPTTPAKKKEAATPKKKRVAVTKSKRKASTTGKTKGKAKGTSTQKG